MVGKSPTSDMVTRAIHGAPATITLDLVPDVGINLPGFRKGLLPRQRRKLPLIDILSQ